MAKDKNVKDLEDEIIEVSLKKDKDPIIDSFFDNSQSDNTKKSDSLVDHRGLMLDNDLINLITI